MTEEEAKTKWCPYARVTNLEGTEAACNRWEDEAGSRPIDEGCGLQIGSYCIASACMAWRWEDEAEEVATDRKCEVCKGSGIIVTGSGETAGGEECNACVGGYQTEAVQLGFCGLAGKP